MHRPDPAGSQGAARTHWKALHELGQAASERADELRTLAESFADVDFERDILPGLQGVKVARIQEATGLSRRYVYEIRNGEKVPSMDHWEALLKLA